MEEFFKGFLHEYGVSFEEDTLQVVLAEHNDAILLVTVAAGYTEAIQALKKKVACLQSSVFKHYEGNTLFETWEIKYHAPAVYFKL